jgi:hypothetical protein
MEILRRDLGLKSSPVDGCHINSAYHKRLIAPIVLELHCTCCNSYNRSILIEQQQEASTGLGTNTNLIQYLRHPLIWFFLDGERDLK